MTGPTPVAAPVVPDATIGILGGGQLGRMLALAARSMGYRVVVVDPTPDAPAAQVADAHLRADLADSAAVLPLAEQADVITYEWENVSAAVLEALGRRVPVYPGVALLRASQHRIVEKETLQRAGIPVAAFSPVRSAGDCQRALAEIGLPSVLKTATLGYDGKGQAVIRSAAEADGAYRALAASGRELILEEWVPFERELSVMVARGRDGGVVTYPAAENIHVNNILDLSIVPARVDEGVAAAAAGLARRIALALDLVGVLGVEMFLAPHGRLLVNELAPRPHNSGHYTIDACYTSQFEQQCRAICGLPLGAPDLFSPVVMANIMGDDWERAGGTPDWRAALADPAVKLHLYGKAEAMPGRKMGHLTAVGKTVDEALARAQAARERLRRGKG